MSEKREKIYECEICRYTELRINHYEEFLKKCGKCMKKYRDSLDSKNIKRDKKSYGEI